MENWFKMCEFIKGGVSELVWHVYANCSCLLASVSMTVSSEVTKAFEMYLCLWKTVYDTLMAREVCIQIIKAQ